MACAIMTQMYLKLSKGLQGCQGMQARGPSQGVQSPPLLPEHPPPSGDKRLAPAVVDLSSPRRQACMAFLHDKEA